MKQKPEKGPFCVIPDGNSRDTRILFYRFEFLSTRKLLFNSFHSFKTEIYTRITLGRLHSVGEANVLDFEHGICYD